MKKYFFTHTLYTKSKRDPQKEYPCGGAFCGKGAREVIEHHKKDGCIVTSDHITMYENNNGCLDSNKPLGSRIVIINAN